VHELNVNCVVVEFVCQNMKLMMNKVVVVELLMNSCSNVVVVILTYVVVILTYVVVELMHWVSRIGDEGCCCC
jgi:hypothetical protein